MIGLAIFLIVTVLFVLLSAATAKANKHNLTLLFMILAAVSAVSSVAIYPLSEQVELKNKTRIEAERARVMINELGSSENYIRYLNAIN